MDNYKEEHVPNDSSALSPEERCIGGTRVLLVKHYDGQSRPPPPSPTKVDPALPTPQRYLLERRVSLQAEKPKPKPKPKRRSTPSSTAFGLLGGVAAAAVGLWLYTKTSGDGGDGLGFE